MLIVASEIDPSSERIIRYLSDTHGVNINAATFQYFRSENGGEFLARVFLIEPSVVEYKTRTKSTSRKSMALTHEELQLIADENGVGQMVRRLTSTLEEYFSKDTTVTSIRFKGTFNGSRKVIFSLVPAKSNSQDGLYFQLYSQKLREFFHVTEQVAMALLPTRKADWKYSQGADAEFSGYDGFFSNAGEVETFLNGLKALANAKTS